MRCRGNDGRQCNGQAARQRRRGAPRRARAGRGALGRCCGRRLPLPHRADLLLPADRPSTTVVNGGVPEPTRPPYRRVNTVEKLFAFIRANLDNDNLSVKYSPFGVPREIGSDPDFRIADEELYYTVDRFRRLNP